MAILHGVPPSPFVRKVRAFLAEKGLPYELRPVPPFPPANATPEFRRMSPLGKVPAYSEGDFSISDSSVICAYLERTHAEAPLYPADARDYARALWLEEYADTKMAETLGAVFFNRIVKERFLGQKSDEAVVRRALDEQLPGVLDYLEGQLGDASYLVGGRFSIADIAVCTQLQQLRHAGETLAAARWPRLAAYAERILSRPSFKGALADEKL
jgi:glutathione S-transferase